MLTTLMEGAFATPSLSASEDDVQSKELPPSPPPPRPRLAPKPRPPVRSESLRAPGRPALAVIRRTPLPIMRLPPTSTPLPPPTSLPLPPTSLHPAPRPPPPQALHAPFEKRFLSRFCPLEDLPAPGGRGAPGAS